MQPISRFANLVNQAKQHIKEISAEELFSDLSQQNEFLLLDVREKEEFVQGHLPCAVHISKGVIEAQIERLIPDTRAKVVVYCSGGMRSALVAYNLKLMGYECVQSLAEGLSGWMRQGLPIES